MNNSEIIEYYLQKSNFCEHTINKKREALNKIGGAFNKLFLDVNREDVFKMIIAMKEKGVWNTSTTINQQIRRLRSLYTFLLQEMFIFDNPMSGIKTPAIKKYRIYGNSQRIKRSSDRRFKNK